MQAFRIFKCPQTDAILVQVKHRSTSSRWGGIAQSKDDTGKPTVSIGAHEHVHVLFKPLPNSRAPNLPDLATAEPVQPQPPKDAEVYNQYLKHLDAVMPRIQAVRPVSGELAHCPTRI